MSKQTPEGESQELEALRRQLIQTQYVLSAVIAQRDKAMNELADAHATIALLQTNTV